MAISVEAVENTFDTGGDVPTSVTQLKVSVPYTTGDFFLDPDEAELLLNAIEGVLYDIGYYKFTVFKQQTAE